MAVAMSVNSALDATIRVDLGCSQSVDLALWRAPPREFLGGTRPSVGRSRAKPRPMRIDRQTLCRTGEDATGGRGVTPHPSSVSRRRGTGHTHEGAREFAGPVGASKETNVRRRARRRGHR